MSLTYINLSKILQELIAKHDCKRIELAKYLKISPARLSNYVSGKRTPDISTIVNICMFYGIDINTFLGVTFSGTPHYKNLKEKEDYVNEEEIAFNKRHEIYMIPIIPIDGKRRELGASVIPVSKLFLPGVKDPEKNAVLFEVKDKFPEIIPKDVEYYVCTKCSSSKIENGDCVFENGRRIMFFTYYDTGISKFLVSDSDRKISIPIKDVSEIDQYYKVISSIGKRFPVIY